MKHDHPFIKKYLPVVISIGLLLLLAISIWYFIDSVKTDYARGQLHLPRHRDAVIENPNDVVGSIRPWMTFDYINVVFKLPADYLKNLLTITNAKYPNIRIDQYAKRNNMSTEVLIKHLGEYITSYRTEHS